MKTIDLYRGSMLGLAVGDAVGTTLEFKAPGTFEPITDMVGGGPFKLKPGEWTDDTSMALCLATSLIEKDGFDPKDQLRRYARWYQHGYMSSNGRCFDIGGTTVSAIGRFIDCGGLLNARGIGEYFGPTEEKTAGNGSIMRLAPIALYYANLDDVDLLTYAANSSRTTHGAMVCLDACKYMACIIAGAVNGYDKPLLLSPELYPHPDSLCNEIKAILEGSFKRMPPDITGDGYVVKTLEAALWAFNKTDNFKDGLLEVVNLGLDADTTGAVYGQIAGAYYGIEGIPPEWLDKLAMRGLISELADQLCYCSPLG